MDKFIMAAQQTLLSQTDTLEELIHGLEAQETVVDKFVAVKPKLTEKNEYEKKEKGFSANFISMLIRDAAVYGGLLTEQEEYAFGEKMDHERKAFIHAVSLVPRFLEHLAELYTSSINSGHKDKVFAFKKSLSSDHCQLKEKRKEMASWCLYLSDPELQEISRDVTLLEENYALIYMKRRTQVKFMAWAKKQTPETCNISSLVFNKSMNAMKEAHLNLVDAQEHLIARNIKLLPIIARSIENKYLPLQDLVQIGSIGMMKGTDKWDHTCGIKYSTYVCPWILAEMTRVSARLGRFIDLTKTSREILVKINDKKAKGQSLTTEEELKVANSHHPLSLDVPVGDNADSDCLIDFLPTKEKHSFEKKIYIKKIRAACEKFQEKIKKNKCHVDILNNRLLADAPCTLQEIADRHKRTRERIRQIEANLLSRMRCFQPLRDAIGEDILQEMTQDKKIKNENKQPLSSQCKQVSVLKCG